ncbi:MAG: hypothetical protein ACI9CQ_003271, partial [Saprospiraceae bacterium]
MGERVIGGIRRWFWLYYEIEEKILVYEIVKNNMINK